MAPFYGQVSTKSRLQIRYGDEFTFTHVNIIIYMYIYIHIHICYIYNIYVIYIYIYVYIYTYIFSIHKQSRNHKLFRARNLSWNQGTSISISRKTQEKEDLHGKIWEIFLLDPLILIVNYLLNVKFKTKIGAIRAFFFQNQVTFSRFSKQSRGGFLSSSPGCAPIFINKHAWIH